MAAPIPYFTLNDGNKIPSVGMGCWMGVPGGDERVFQMCKTALKNGYRLFDTAAGYGNEFHVGRAIRDSGIPRSEIYLTTKLPNHNHHRVRESFEESLQALNCEYIDLYLIHWPQGSISAISSMGDPAARVLTPDEHPTFIDTWKEMEKLLETGKVKSIGVSNFSVKTLNELLPHCSVIPAVNQVELHPCLPQEDLRDLCNEKGILLAAYSPLGQTSTVFYDDPIIKGIADRLEVTSAQVVLSWGVQRGTVVVPKSENEQRMITNISLTKISDEDMRVLDTLHQKPDMHKSLVWVRAQDGVFGWKFEWLGWNLVEGGKVKSYL